MPLVVLGDMSKYDRTLVDPELRELLDKLKKYTGDRWVIHQFAADVGPVGGWFRRQARAQRFTLYVELLNGAEWQVINMLGDNDEGWGRHFTRQQVGNFMLGYTSALDFNRRQDARGRETSP